MWIRESMPTTTTLVEHHGWRPTRSIPSSCVPRSRLTTRNWRKNFVDVKSRFMMLVKQVSWTPLAAVPVELKKHLFSVDSKMFLSGSSKDFSSSVPP